MRVYLDLLDLLFELGHFFREVPDEGKVDFVLQVLLPKLLVVVHLLFVFGTDELLGEV